MPKGATLYDDDFFLWTQEQAAALRQAKESNLPLDWENLAEEIDSLGRSQRRELNSQIRRILRDLFKLAASGASEPRVGWRTTILDARTEVADLLEDSPSLRREVDGIVRRQAVPAAKLAASDLEQYGEPADPVWVRLQKGEFSADEVLGDWFPEVTG
jgi:hypothetical protein